MVKKNSDIQRQSHDEITTALNSGLQNIASQIDTLRKDFNTSKRQDRSDRKEFVSSLRALANSIVLGLVINQALADRFSWQIAVAGFVVFVLIYVIANYIE